MSSWKLLTAAYNGSGDNDKVRIDPVTNSLQTLEYEHREIHGGDSFSCHYEHEVTGDDEMVVIAFNTPNTTKWIHIIVAAAVTNQSKLAMYENTSIDVDEGTQLTIYNRNRNSATQSGVTSIETTPVANKATSFDDVQAAGANITTSTELAAITIGAQGGASPVSQGLGGLQRGSQEWVLEQNQQYAFMVTNLSAHTNIITIELNWYEHTDIN